MLIDSYCYITIIDRTLLQGVASGYGYNYAHSAVTLHYLKSLVLANGTAVYLCNMLATEYAERAREALADARVTCAHADKQLRAGREVLLQWQACLSRAHFLVRAVTAQGSLLADLAIAGSGSASHMNDDYDNKNSDTDDSLRTDKIKAYGNPDTDKNTNYTKSSKALRALDTIDPDAHLGNVKKTATDKSRDISVNSRTRLTVGARLAELEHSALMWQARLEKRVNRLSSIHNRLDSNEPVLATYVPAQNVNILRDRLEELPAIKRSVADIRSQYEVMSRQVREDLLGRQLSALKNMCQEAFDSNADLPVQLSELEYDLIDIVHSLTSHYDQCLALNDSKLDTQDREDLLNIVRADHDRLPEILEDLQTTMKDVHKAVNNCEILGNTCSEFRISIKKQANKLLLELHRQQEYLVILRDIATLITDYQSNCLEDIQIVQGLCDFYEGFEHSYYKLLEEVERRRKTTEAMEEAIKSCERKLQELDQEDRNARENFLSEHGDYLPKNILPTNLDDGTPLYKISYTLKKI